MSLHIPRVDCSVPTVKPQVMSCRQWQSWPWVPRSVPLEPGIWVSCVLYVAILSSCIISNTFFIVEPTHGGSAAVSSALLGSSVSSQAGGHAFPYGFSYYSPLGNSDWFSHPKMVIAHVNSAYYLAHTYEAYAKFKVMCSVMYMQKEKKTWILCSRNNLIKWAREQCTHAYKQSESEMALCYK